MKYLVTITYAIEIEADDKNEAQMQAGMAMDLSDAKFEIEKLNEADYV